MGQGTAKGPSLHSANPAGRDRFESGGLFGYGLLILEIGVSVFEIYSYQSVVLGVVGDVRGSL
jgi:hypothetical protein